MTAQETKVADTRVARAVEMIKIMAAIRQIDPRDMLVRIVELEAQRIAFPKRRSVA